MPLNFRPNNTTTGGTDLVLAILIKRIRIEKDWDEEPEQHLVVQSEIGALISILRWEPTAPKSIQEFEGSGISEFQF